MQFELDTLIFCFVFRESEAIIPNIFFFLVLLSYERYHSKQIIGIPKIIQLCDGIMASGRKAVTHGNSKKKKLLFKKKGKKEKRHQHLLVIVQQ